MLLDEPGVEVWFLSNGMNVLCKPTKLEPEELIIEGSAPGGWSELSSGELISGRLSDAIAAEVAV